MDRIETNMRYIANFNLYDIIEIIENDIFLIYIKIYDRYIEVNIYDMSIINNELLIYRFLYIYINYERNIGRIDMKDI